MDGNAFGFRVITSISRPSLELVGRFGGVRSSDVSDATQEANGMDAGLHPLYRPIRSVVGPAVTVTIPRGSHFPLFKIGMQQTRSGDVLVVNARGDPTSAVIGGNIAKALKARGVAAVIIDGAARDTEQIQALDLPVFVRSVTPNAGFAWGAGEVNVPVACGGVVVNPGDLVVADEDGVAVIPLAAAEAILSKLQEASRKAAALQPALERGEVTNIDQITAKLIEEGCVIS